MINYSDDCEAKASKATWRQARKAHRCCACHEPIPAGHRYHYVSGIWDHGPDSFKHCARCWQLYEELLDRTQWGDVVDLFLDCGQSWEDVFSSAPPDEIAALAFLTPAEAQTTVGTKEVSRK
jgi:hypothetical protein